MSPKYKKESSMNPFSMWSSMKASVKITIVVCGTLILIASMYFGFFDEILGLLRGKE